MILKFKFKSYYDIKIYAIIGYDLQKELNKILTEIKTLDINFNLYFENMSYQKMVDSQFTSIKEKLYFVLKTNNQTDKLSEIKESLYVIEGLNGEIDFLESIIHHIIEKDDINYTPQEKNQLINIISKTLQNEMVTREISIFLNSHGMNIEIKDFVDNKFNYVSGLLINCTDNQLSQIANSLDIQLQNSGIIDNKDFKVLIKNRNLSSIEEDFNRAVNHISKDPELSINSASSTLESICKAIIELENQKLPKDKSLKPLLKEVVNIINLSPVAFDDSEIKRILGGLQNIIIGIGVLRTGFSTAHGHSIKKYKLSGRHVRLVVNSMYTCGLFILETYDDMKMIKGSK